MMEDLIQKFNLSPHPEGGFYRETYRSEQNVITILEDESSENAARQRSACTAIYFLISPGNISRLHRIKSDEIWHFYLGSPLSIIEIGNEFQPNNFRETILGHDIAQGQLVQYTVKRGTWFGCYPAVDPTDPRPHSSSIMKQDSYSFVGCTVAPGFDFADFELASRSKLLDQFPKASEIIIKLTEGLP
jgi:predicted cupin superfamily sugar epimerase